MSGTSQQPASWSGTLLAVLVVAGIGGALAAGVLVTFRVGAYVLAGVLAALAAVRLLLPSRVVGPFAVRSRWLDGATMLAMAVALVVLAQGVPL